MDKIYGRPRSIKEKVSGYCPGCLHGVANKIVAEVLDELELREKAICVLPVGCGTLGLFYWNVDMISSAHGRAPAVATGIKRCSPEKFVFCYQGDGDLAAIGLSEIMHAANRGENFSVVFVNNSIYGMTGGQMAPTTLEEQYSTTTQKGRNPLTEGYPMKMCEIISTLEAPRYVARFSMDSPQNIVKAKAGIKKAFVNQLEKKGFSFVELLSNCPTNWGMTPLESLEWMRTNTLKVFPPGLYKEVE